MPKEPTPAPGPDREPNPGPVWTPEIDEPEPDRLPDEEPNPNPDENDEPPLYASLQGRHGCAKLSRVQRRFAGRLTLG